MPVIQAKTCIFDCNRGILGDHLNFSTLRMFRYNFCNKFDCGILSIRVGHFLGQLNYSKFHIGSSPKIFKVYLRKIQKMN